MRYAVCAFAICLFIASAARPGFAAPPTVTVFHAFNVNQGVHPHAPLVLASDGNFYGTTSTGGDDGNGCAQVCTGTVFKLTPQGQLTVLHTFVGFTNGANPESGLVEGPDGNLYGTTFIGGPGGPGCTTGTPCGSGVVYKISKSGTFQKLHDFCTATPCSDANPRGSLVLGRDGYFYGTTVVGPNGLGVIFRISSTGQYTVIASFTSALGASVNGLVQATDGNFYGTAGKGVFRVTPAGQLTPLHFFDGVRGTGQAELIQASDGNLYGAITAALFRISMAGDYQEILLTNADTTGTNLHALLPASDGNLWGTSSPAAGCCSIGVYTATTAGTLLQGLSLAANIGIPSAPLIQGADGRLYGTAIGGTVAGGTGFGTVFVVDAGLAPPQPHTDLMVSSAASSNPPVGGTITYTLGITNNGPAPATGVTLTDTISGAATFVSAAPSQGNCNHAGGVVTCTLGDVGYPASATVTIVVQRTTIGPITNVATVAGNELDSFTANNSATVSAGNMLSTSDFNGDAVGDVAVWRPATGVWYTRNSGGGSVTATAWGVGVSPYDDVPVPGDYDGDGKTDLAVWRRSNGTWYVVRSSNHSVMVQAWGAAAAPSLDVPVPGDYDGDGKTDIAVWRRATGMWYVIKSSGGVGVQALGAGYPPYNDVAVPGDYDGDGKTDYAVWRASTGTWYVIKSSNAGIVTRTWGAGYAPYNDVPVPGDYDGDGKTDFAVWRASTGTWYVVKSTNNATTSAQWGAGYAPYNDVPVPSDYDGDGKTDYGVWRPSAGVWFVIRSSNGSVMTQPWGAGYAPYNDNPLPFPTAIHLWWKPY
jgi:uncharacterized repeat protein (TIGR01451 family)